MANEEDIQQEGSENQSQQAGGTAAGAGTGTEGQQQSGSPKAGNAPTVSIEDLNKKIEEISESNKNLQSQFTEVSQEAARSRELLTAIDPYIDYARMRGESGGGGSEGEGEGEGEESYLTGKQVEKMITDVKKGVNEKILAMNIRSKYPDIFDNGPNEVLGRYFLQNKTIPTEKAEKRIEQAVKLTREHLKSLEDKGKKTADEEKAKAEAEAKAKAAAAAKASGLSPSGATTTTPKPQEDENKPVTADDYVAGRQEQRLKRQNI